jgi:hypothetical protein
MQRIYVVIGDIALHVTNECHDDYLTTLYQLQWFSDVECSVCHRPWMPASKVPPRHLSGETVEDHQTR